MRLSANRTDGVNIALDAGAHRICAGIKCQRRPYGNLVALRLPGRRTRCFCLLFSLATEITAQIKRIALAESRRGAINSHRHRRHRRKGNTSPRSAAGYLCSLNVFCSSLDFKIFTAGQYGLIFDFSLRLIDRDIKTDRSSDANTPTAARASASGGRSCPCSAAGAASRTTSRRGDLDVCAGLDRIFRCRCSFDQHVIHTSVKAGSLTAVVLVTFNHSLRGIHHDICGQRSGHANVARSRTTLGIRKINVAFTIRLNRPKRDAVGHDQTVIGNDCTV